MKHLQIRLSVFSEWHYIEYIFVGMPKTDVII